LSFHEISIAVRAENRTAGTFRSIALDVANLGAAFGVLSNEQVKAVSVLFTVVRVFQSAKAILSTLTVAETAHNVAVGASATVQTTLTGTIVGETTARAAQNAVTNQGTLSRIAHNLAVKLGFADQTALTGAVVAGTGAQAAQNVSTNQGVLSQVAHKIALAATTAAHYIHAAGTWVATAAQNALNISYATFLALTGVGIAVIVAAAAAMWYFASSMNAAASSVTNFNGAAGRLPFSGRSIQRAGESELTRRGIE
jgi:hypothetical protein